ncbi:MAG: helix-hairpin-helix domain-containing protein [Tepidisphaeraceae bacterium]
MLATPSQRRGGMVVLGILIMILALRLALNPATVDESPSAQAPASSQLADRIDPNVATEAELAAIPELGEKRAAAVVQFREQFKSRHPDQSPFQRLSDLEQVPGIGAATAETIEPYLTFPAWHGHPAHAGGASTARSP